MMQHFWIQEAIYSYSAKVQLTDIQCREVILLKLIFILVLLVPIICHLVLW